MSGGDWIEGLSTRQRLAITIGGWLVYSLILAPVDRLGGPAVTALVVLPIALAAWLSNRWLGLAAGPAAFLFHLLILTAAGSDSLTGISGPSALWPMLSLAAVGYLVGWLGETRRSLRKQVKGYQQALADLSESEARFRAIFENGHYASFVVDPETLLVHDANAAFERLYGYSKADIAAGLPATQLSAEPDTSHLTLKRALSEGPQVSLGRYHRKKDGSEFEVGVTVTVYQWRGRRLANVVVLDMSERRQAEEALRENEANFRGVVTASADGILLTDEVGRIVEYNEAIQAISGLSRDEAIGRFVWDVQSQLAAGQTAEALDRGRAATQQALATGQAPFLGKMLEVSTRRRDGSLVIVHQRVFAMHTDRGWRLGSITRDVTERANAEAALRESEARYRSVVTESADGILLSNEDGRIIECNQAMAAITGIPIEAALGQFIWDYQTALLPPERRSPARSERFKTDIQTALAQGDGPFLRQALEAILRGPDGEPRIIQQKGFAVKTGRGWRLGSISRDITLARQAEAALRESEARYRAIVNAVPDVLFKVSPAGVILDYRTPERSDLFAAPEMLLGRSIRDLLPAETVDAALKAIEQALRTGGLALFEYTLSRGERRRYLEARVVPLGDDVLAVIRDVTERRRAEEEARRVTLQLETMVTERTAALALANAELKQANRAKDDFLAIMSHELRTPLNAILALTESLAEGIYGDLTERQRGSLGTIKRSGQHLLSLISDILNLARIEAGKLELDLTPAPIGPICQASLQVVEELAGRKNITMALALDPEVRRVMADERFLKQMLVNLLDNAVKFTPEGGQVGLEVRGDLEAQAVYFTVWDTGIGLSAEDAARLFRPFTQLDSGLTRHYEGAGLGLAMVQRIARLHGGEVAVASAPDQGSRFTIALPWTGPSQKRTGPLPKVEAPAAPPPAAAAGQRILLVEDNAETRVACGDFLTARGYHVDTAEEGATAIALARQTRPDLILMDIQMPGMNGLEAIRRLRADPDFARVPIIAVTALVMPGDRERCLDAGADGYLTKPVGLKLLAETIWTHLHPGPAPEDPRPAAA